MRRLCTSFYSDRQSTELTDPENAMTTQRIHQQKTVQDAPIAPATIQHSALKFRQLIASKRLTLLLTDREITVSFPIDKSTSASYDDHNSSEACYAWRMQSCHSCHEWLGLAEAHGTRVITCWSLLGLGLRCH